MSDWERLKRKIQKKFTRNGCMRPTAYVVKAMIDWLRENMPYVEETNYTINDLCLAADNIGYPYKNYVLAHTEQCGTECPDYPVPPCYIHANEEKPMRDDFTVKTSANVINISPAATAAVESRTDLQDQREYLLSRHRDVYDSLHYGKIRQNMRDAFRIDLDNTPKTAKDLVEGIKSGKYTVDATKQAIQDIDMKGQYYDNDPLYAMNWGGLDPDRLGYDTALASFKEKLKAAKDTIMIGDPTAGLAALQALEAWSPPATAAAN